MAQASGGALAGKTVVLLGGSGFLGRHIAQELLAAYASRFADRG